MELNFPHFTAIKEKFFILGFITKLQLIGIFWKIGPLSARNITKNFPFLQVCWPTLAFPIPPGHFISYRSMCIKTFETQCICLQTNKRFHYNIRGERKGELHQVKTGFLLLIFFSVALLLSKGRRFIASGLLLIAKKLQDKALCTFCQDCSVNSKTLAYSDVDRCVRHSKYY